MHHFLEQSESIDQALTVYLQQLNDQSAVYQKCIFSEKGWFYMIVSRINSICNLKNIQFTEKKLHISSRRNNSYNWHGIYMVMHKCYVGNFQTLQISLAYNFAHTCYVGEWSARKDLPRLTSVFGFQRRAAQSGWRRTCHSLNSITSEVFIILSREISGACVREKLCMIPRFSDNHDLSTCVSLLLYV